MSATAEPPDPEPAPAPVGLYDASYGGFSQQVYEEIRQQTYGEDLGQSSWTTARELDGFLVALQLAPDRRLLDVACGSGGPGLYLARRSGCELLGIDLHEDAVTQARTQARAGGLQNRARFERLDASRPLPLEAGTFDALLCIDAINHFPEREDVLDDWVRLLKPGGLLLFTDPIVVTGILSSEEIAVRSSIGFFLFASPEEDERLLRIVGLDLLACEDATASVYEIAARWRQAREDRAEELREIEGDESFEGQQEFLRVADRLARSGRLSRILYLSRKPG